MQMVIKVDGKLIQSFVDTGGEQVFWRAVCGTKNVDCLEEENKTKPPKLVDQKNDGSFL